MKSRYGVCRGIYDSVYAVFHIPLQEYKEAYELYEKGDPRVTYYYGEIGETMIDKIYLYKYASSLFN